MAEVYSAPRPAWDQGDVVEEIYFPSVDAKLPAILMTPICDIDQDKVHVWTFVALYPDADVALEIIRPVLAGWAVTPAAIGAFALSGNQRKEIRKNLANLLLQRYPRYHWLPVPIGASQGHAADFTQITSIPIEEARSLGRVCSLNSSWREQVQARYVAYMGRVGTEDLPREEIERHLDRLALSALGNVSNRPE